MTNRIVLLSCFLRLCVSWELMCGPNYDIPCSLYGCGDKNKDGLYGQLPCEKNYPRDCDFAFRSTLWDYEDRVINLNIPKFTFPKISDFKGKSMKLNNFLEDPIMYRKTGEEVLSCTIVETAYVKCVKDMDFYNVDCTVETHYPYLHDATAKKIPKGTVPLDGLFSIYGTDGGKEISVNPISNMDAVSLYSALRNTSTVLTLECDVQSSIDPVKSCLLFESVPTNESPSLSRQKPSKLYPKYRFEKPPVPALTFPKVIEGERDEYNDAILNKNNHITTLFGVVMQYCTGTILEYQGEEGSWYSVFLDTEGYYRDLDHILYVDGAYIYSSTIQYVWASLEPTLAGRNLRMNVECLNSRGISFGTGYLYFGTTYAPWDGEDITCYWRQASETFCLKQ